MNLDYQLGFYHKALGEGHGRGQKQFKKTDTRTYIRKMIKKKKLNVSSNQLLFTWLPKLPVVTPIPLPMNKGSVRERMTSCLGPLPGLWKGPI
jgi:hypothetical protein